MSDDFDEIRSVQAAVRQILDDATDPEDAWETFAEAGFGSIGLDGIDDVPLARLLAAISEATGSCLTDIPFIAHSVIAATVAGRLPHTDGDAIPANHTVVLATPLTHSAWDATPDSVDAQHPGDVWRLNAEISGVLNAASATQLLVPAVIDGQSALFTVTVSEPHTTVTPVSGADPSRPIADIRLKNAPAQLRAHGPQVDEALRAGLALGTACVAAESIGAAEAFLDQTISYLKERWAFGRPVGSFQAVKHTVVDLFAELALAKALLRDALPLLDAEREVSDGAITALMLAKTRAASAFTMIANRGILLHGAIGFTWELGAHRFVRRALTDKILLGDTDAANQRIADHIAQSVPNTPERSLESAEEWLAENAPLFVGTRDHVGHFAVLSADEITDQLDRARRWEKTKFEAGFAGISVPDEFGGQGATLYEALRFQSYEHHYDLPHWIFGITHGMILPTILRWGTEEQKSRFVRPMLDGTELWCQLFSEPSVGSDLAMLSTRAERVDGGWRVNGQKVWNSGADLSDLGLLVARTDPNVPKHAGLTVFTVPMDADGVTVRPIIQASGSALFCEVFFEDVFLPDSAVVGEVGNGWRVALTTLMNERVALTGDGVPFHRALGLARAREAQLSPAARERLVDVFALFRALAAMSEQVLEGLRTGAEPGPEGSVNKLLTGRAATTVADFVSRVLGPELLRDRDWHEYVIGNLGLLIGGGTEEIQKNIIAERVLGLPAEPKSGARVSWTDEKTRTRSGAESEG